MTYSFIDITTNTILGIQHLSVGLSRGHHFTIEGRSYVVSDITDESFRSATVYLTEI